MLRRALSATIGVGLLMAPLTLSTAQTGLEAWLQRLQSPDAGVREAAWLEAARYGPGAIRPLGGLMAGEDKTSGRAARLAMEVIVSDAGAPGAGGKRAAVSRAICEVLKSEQPAATRAVEMRMLGLVGGDEVVPTLVGLLADKDVADDARQALERIPGQAATMALLQALSAAPVERKPGFVNSLGRRCAAEAVPTLTALAAGPDEPVRIAALAALGRTGDPRALDAVTRSLVSPDAANRVAAADALMLLAERRLAAGDGDAARRMCERVLRTDLPTGRRVAALSGIKAIGDPAALGTVLQSLGDRDPVFHNMAMGLIDQFAGANVVQIMKDAARTASPAAKAGLMLGLATRDDGTVAGTLLEGLFDPSDEVKAAAAAGLGIIKYQTAAPALWKLAETGAEPAKSAALSSAIILLDAQRAEAGATPPPALLAEYNHALGIATEPAERNMALAGVAAYGDPSSLKLVEPLTLDAATRAAALRAYVAIGRALVAQGKRDEAKVVFQNAIARGAPRDLAAESAAQLRGLGVEIDLAREAGFISDWWLVGIFPNRDQGGFNVAYAPETGAEPPNAISFEGQELAWKRAHTDDIEGIVDLERQFATRTNVVAYAYAVISVEREQDVTLRIGSDDAVKVWVNGERVHANNAYRPLRVDEDTAEATLSAGDNTVLVKVCQGGGQWSFCVRLVGADGLPVKFEAKK
jgi:HEAT repeat protein